MADILYVYRDKLYVNLTNRCQGNCAFCVRNQADGVGDAGLILDREPTVEELKEALDKYDGTKYDELTFCGYGEPTCAVDKLIALAGYYKKKTGGKVRLNTNGLGRSYNHRDILPELCDVVDIFSISLNAPNAEKYNKIVRPAVNNAFEELLSFARDAVRAGKEVILSVVSILDDTEIEECSLLADSVGAKFRVRVYDDV